MKKLLLIFLILNSQSSILNSLSAQTQIALLKYGGGGDWYANPTSLTNLIAYCNADAQMNLAADYAVVDVGSSEIFNYPFLHMTGHGNVVFNSQEAQNLRNYLIGGGFLHIDDNYGLKDFIVPQMKQVFPELDFIELPSPTPSTTRNTISPTACPKSTSTTTCPHAATASSGRGGWYASSAGSATSATAGKTPTCTTTASPPARKPSKWARTSCNTSSPTNLGILRPSQPGSKLVCYYIP